jgi:transcriptional regulator with XRE-family HTH domain
MSDYPSDVAHRFGENLQHFRKRAGCSQEELSFRASLHRTEISLLERGERMPRIDTAIKLAISLSMSLDELVAGIKWTPGETLVGGFRLRELSS